jgi:hypothetical protein
MFAPGKGVNPKAPYTHPIEISVPVAGVVGLHVTHPPQKLSSTPKIVPLSLGNAEGKPLEHM